jgi:hypothetical protein
MFALVVHGDVAGAENTRRALSDWLRFMKLSPAGAQAEMDRYIGYWRPYATSHDELDADPEIQDEVRNAARALVEGLRAQRAGRWLSPGEDLVAPREK